MLLSGCVKLTGHFSLRGVLALAPALVGLMVLAAPGNASASECEGGTDGNEGTSFACGEGAATRFGYSVAIGSSGDSGLSATNTNASAATAVGYGAVVGHPVQNPDGSTGWAGFQGTAIGYNTYAAESSTTALGSLAKAYGQNSMALGADAVASRDNQIAIGTGGNTYTLAGVNSQASKDAQGATTYLMTTDSDGNLAASTFDVATLENLPAQVAQNSADITNLGTTVNNHTTQITANTTELADHETRITNNTTQITANTTELADHEMRITNNTNTLNVHTTEIADLDTRVTTNTTNIATLDGRVGALEAGFQDLGDQISENRTEARAGTALALATAGLRYDDRPGKLSLAGGFGNFKGQSGLALGLGYNPSLDFRLNGAISATTNHGDVGVSLGASWTLN
ncbi:hypothetical protein C9427_18545 [Mesorhizobium helmanticense]|uniref:Trimeric autotransporter adhesin YadA-like C-terminal membrane anchor domain-containing protein n=2 Tax=Mesorhizobium helmanticense TaxID=1776423 RepID=A0A2T4ITN8_9HYPH|nr:hypothetical protein C9427_18545 [Mesorhizobium helmanticense]